MDGWTDGWMDGWMDGRTDGWMNGECDVNNYLTNRIIVKTETSPYSSTHFIVYRRNRSEKTFSPTNEGP